MGTIKQFLPNDEHPKRRAAVIGAGPAGLVTAKTLMEFGFDVAVYESGSYVGGTWIYNNDNGRQLLYKNLHINTSKALTAFSGLPFPKETQAIPDHRDMAQYFAAYAEHFNVKPKVQFNSPVREVLPVPVVGSKRSQWRVIADNQSPEVFDIVAVCTGAFDKPKSFAGAENFAGEYLHSSEYREPERYVGKHVCVVGAGNSAVDIASDLCTTAGSVTLVARSAVKIVPHFVAGRSLNDINRSLQKWWIPDAVRRFITKTLVSVVHGSETTLGFKPLKHRVHPTISSTIVQDILFSRVKVRHGIEKISGRNITFSDGTSQDFDTIIAATGFTIGFPFLSREIIDCAKGNLDLYLRMMPPEWPSLYFVGMVNPDTPINFACERQARWIAAFERDGAALPDTSEMCQQIADKNAWVVRFYGTAGRHSFQEESKIYYRELDNALRKARKRAARSSTLRDNRALAERNFEQQRRSKISTAANEPAAN